MADVVEQLPFGWHSTSDNLGYAWDQWLDGQAWRLVQGVDFTEDARSMQRRAYAAGKRTPGVVKVNTKNRVEDGALVLYLQAQLAGEE
jgi:hypothetical protein